MIEPVAMIKPGRGLTRVLLIALLCASGLAVATPAHAVQLSVCPSNCQFTSIAAALQQANDGDSIVIDPGTYSGGVEITKDVRLYGKGRDLTTITGTSSSSVIRVRPGAKVSIVALTITGGGGSRVGIDVVGGGILNEGQLTLIDSTVRTNVLTSPDSLGGGLYSNSSKTLDIYRTVFSGNRAGRGGGIYIREGEVFLTDSTVSGNVADKNGGGISHGGRERLQLRKDSVVRDNRAIIGGGISVVSRLEIYDSTVSGNRAQFGGGVASGSLQPVQVDASTISGNISDTLGGGLYVGDAGAELSDTTVENNQSPLGAGIHTTAGDVSLTQSTVRGNVAASDGGGILTRAAEVELTQSMVIDNRAARGGGIFVEPAGSVRVGRGSVIAGNQPDQCFGSPCVVR